jgi:hypothetical protein
MLPIKAVDKLRKMYFDGGYTVTEISRKMHYSPTTIYRYIKMTDFNEKPKMPSRQEIKITPYIPDLKQWLEEDKSRHRKQRHTAKKAHERLKEMYPDYDVSYTCLNYHFQKLRKEVFKTNSRYLSLTHIPGGVCQAGCRKLFYSNMINSLPI